MQLSQFSDGVGRLSFNHSKCICRQECMRKYNTSYQKRKALSYVSLNEEFSTLLTSDRVIYSVRSCS